MRVSSLLLAFTLAGVCLGCKREAASTSDKGESRGQRQPRIEESLPQRPPARQTPEAEYEGKPLSYWVANSRSGSMESRWASIPAFTALLKNDAPGVRRTAALALGDIGPDAKVAVPVLIELLKDEDEDVWRAATIALGQMGSDAKASIPALADVKRSGKDSSCYAFDAMADIGSAAVPTLIDFLKDKDQHVRHDAAFALARTGPEARAAIPTLLELLKDQEHYVRSAAAVALGGIGPEAKTVIPALVQVLKDENAFVRQYAASSLGLIGSKAKTAVPALTTLLKDEDNHVQAGRCFGSREHRSRGENRYLHLSWKCSGIRRRDFGRPVLGVLRTDRSRGEGRRPRFNRIAQRQDGMGSAGSGFGPGTDRGEDGRASPLGVAQR